MHRGYFIYVLFILFFYFYFLTKITGALRLFQTDFPRLTVVLIMILSVKLIRISVLIL